MNMSDIQPDFFQQIDEYDGEQRNLIDHNQLTIFDLGIDISQFFN